ncbi:hypothetical protein F383_15948 [Gossypium arboreum]|uniref:Uncharacterized protein n=1 Tax=Gossypium arboreum TaxID=29729 RepID=A0A0B0NHX2_GOSAR|nr:hypothetical protein F383_15948 [Gossypium arboreum]
MRYYKCHLTVTVLDSF